jgi:hypothetical protein
MSVNRHQPHILVLPEDDANRQLATGFTRDRSVAERQIQVLAPAGGWKRVLECFQSDHVGMMNECPFRFMILLIDFDGKDDRLGQAQRVIPKSLTERVFVLGAWTEPEDLKKATLGSYETIRMDLAKDCREDANTTWGHELLKHNAGEITRLRERVRPFLFQP